MDILEIVVVLNLLASSTEPALVEDVYQDREPYGEYLFHAAANSDAVVLSAPQKRSILGRILGAKKEQVQQISANEYKVMHEVSVSFDKNGLQIAKGYIDESHTLIDTDNFHTLNDKYDLVSGGLNDVFIKLGDSQKHMQIAAGEDHASYATLSHSDDSSADIVFEYWRVTGNRTLRIVSISRHPEYSISELYQYWLNLIDQYSDMPMNQFSGASSY